MTAKDPKLPAKAPAEEVEGFLRKVAATPPPARRGGTSGRLIFAMDATASREPTWDQACHIQAQMFSETANLGGLQIQLCYYRGFYEFAATGWLNNAEALSRHMTGVRCAGGQTQLARVLEHTLGEAKNNKINALVFVGDCMEEGVDTICALAGQLGLLGIPTFVFHEGHDPVAERTFKEVARLTKGAYCRFDAGSAQQLRDLLSAVAVYAAGGRRALERFGKKKGRVVELLTHQVGRA